MIGQYAASGSGMDLVLNDFKRQQFDFTPSFAFWKLFATYEHIV